MRIINDNNNNNSNNNNDSSNNDDNNNDNNNNNNNDNWTDMKFRPPEKNLRSLKYHLIKFTWSAVVHIYV